MYLLLYLYPPYDMTVLMFGFYSLFLLDSRLHNTFHNGFVKTYLVMFQQDPRCHTKPVFGCLERAKATAGEVCHRLWMPPLIVRGQDAIPHTF